MEVMLVSTEAAEVENWEEMLLAAVSKEAFLSVTMLSRVVTMAAAWLEN
jgi:hypothetical protein